MITFRDVVRRERVDEKLEYLAARLALEDAEGAFVEAGELEQGVLDALHPERDGWGSVERQLRELSRWTGAAFRASRAGAGAASPLRRAAAALQLLREYPLPERLHVRAPEGYVHYALDPVGYARAAERYARDVGARRAERAVVVGIRSIGTSLSGIVAAELGTMRTVTVRPRTAGCRRIEAEPALAETLRRWMEGGGDLLVVDEGPGATGETFQCVAAWLELLGIDPGRIVLLPSHVQPPGLGSPAVREFFERSRRYAPPVESDRVERVCARLGLTRARDLSAGRWREVVPGADGAAAIPRHERLKFLALDPEGRPHLIRYVGLGRTGLEATLRARRLGTLGFGPEVVAREDGFLATRWVEGHALSADCLGSQGFALALGAYLCARVTLFRTGQPAELPPILEMLRENAVETLGPAPAGLTEALRLLERLPPREATIPDARLQAREWIRTADRYVKLDAIDHGDGVRLPGPADPAWDVAAAAVEFGFDPPTLAELVRLCGRSAAGGLADFERAVEAYRSPYAASQLGEASLAARESDGGPDEPRLVREVDRYRELLRRELARARERDPGVACPAGTGA